MTLLVCLIIDLTIVVIAILVGLLGAPLVLLVSYLVAILIMLGALGLRLNTLVDLLLLEVEDFLCLLRRQIRLSEIYHLFEILRGETAADESRVQGLPSPDLLLGAAAVEAVRQQLLVGLRI